MSAEGMLTAINNARRKALPAIAQSPGASEWELLDPTTPLALTALRAAAATGDREAVLATLQQQMAPIKPTPLEVKVREKLGLMQLTWPAVIAPLGVDDTQRAVQKDRMIYVIKSCVVNVLSKSGPRILLPLVTTQISMCYGNQE